MDYLPVLVKVRKLEDSQEASTEEMKEVETQTVQRWFIHCILHKSK